MQNSLSRIKKIFFWNLFVILIFICLFIYMTIGIMSMADFYVLSILNSIPFMLSFLYMLFHLKDAQAYTEILNKRISRKIKKLGKRLDHE